MIVRCWAEDVVSQLGHRCLGRQRGSLWAGTVGGWLRPASHGVLAPRHRRLVVEGVGMSSGALTARSLNARRCDCPAPQAQGTGGPRPGSNLECPAIESLEPFGCGPGVPSEPGPGALDGLTDRDDRGGEVQVEIDDRGGARCSGAACRTRSSRHVFFRPPSECLPGPVRARPCGRSGH